MKRRLEELCEAYLDGATSAEECRRLDELLRDKDARKEFIRAAAMEVELPFALAAAPERIADSVWKPLIPAKRGESGVPSVPGGRGGTGAISPISWRRIALPALLAAAASVAIVSAFWYFTLYLRFEVPNSALTARVVHVNGSVKVASLNHDGIRQLAIDDVVGPDCRMTVDPGARITLSYPDGSRIQVMENTRIMTSAGSSIRLVQLDSGTIFATISPQPEGRKLIFTTPHALLRIVGTQFKLSADEKRSRVEVEEGKLVFTSKEDDRSVVVAENDSAVTGKD